MQLRSPVVVCQLLSSHDATPGKDDDMIAQCACLCAADCDGAAVGIWLAGVIQQMRHVACGQTIASVPDSHTVQRKKSSRGLEKRAAAGTMVTKVSSPQNPQNLVKSPSKVVYLRLGWWFGLSAP